MQLFRGLEKTMTIRMEKRCVCGETALEGGDFSGEKMLKKSKYFEGIRTDLIKKKYAVIDS